MAQQEQINRDSWDRPEQKRNGCLSFGAAMLMLLIGGLIGFLIATWFYKEASTSDATISESVIETSNVASAKDIITAEDSTHMFFSGVPINGSHELVTKRLIAAGWEEQEYANYLVADYAGYSRCKAYIWDNTVTDNVRGLTIVVINSDTWGGLEDCYKNLKQSLSRKYGKPIKVTEKFKRDVLRDSRFKYFALQGGDCIWESTFTTPKGQVIVAIEYDKSYAIDGYVAVYYKDKINSKKYDEASMDNL